MKKIFSILILAAMAFAAFAIPVAAETTTAHESGRDLVYNAAYGTPVVDGIMDDVYLQSDVMYAEVATFSSSASVKTGETATAEYRIVWNQKSFFIFCTVTDPTRSNPGAANASATKMDNTDIYVMCDPAFSIENDYSNRKVDPSGQFRFNPNCTVDQEPSRATSWGNLTVANQLMGTLNYVGGYLSPDSTTDGSYYFELSFDFNSAYQNTLKENVKTLTPTAMGISLQINDVMDNDTARDAMVYSNNATGGLSSNLKNCGKIMLAYQEGVQITDPFAPEETTEDTSGETTAEAPSEEETTVEDPAESTTEETEETTAEETEETAESTAEEPAQTTEKPEETKANTSGESGCSSALAGGSAVLLLTALFGSAFVVSKKASK